MKRYGLRIPKKERKEIGFDDFLEDGLGVGGGEESTRDRQRGRYILFEKDKTRFGKGMKVGGKR